MEEEKILNVTQLQVVDKIQNDDVILLIRDTGNGKQCFQIKGSDFRGESAYEAAQKQGFEGTYSEWVQQIKEVTEYDTKTLLSFIGNAANDANSALRSGIYPSVTKNVPIDGEEFTVQTLRTTTAAYNQYVSTQIALGVTVAAIGKVYIRKITQMSGETIYGDWIKINHEKKSNTKTQYVIGKAMPIGKLSGGTRLNAYLARFGHFRFKLSNVPKLTKLLQEIRPFDKVNELLRGVTWHVFIDDDEVYTGAANAIYGGGVLYIYISAYQSNSSFYKLDESKSSVDLSSDMYIYLNAVCYLGLQNFTSKTLFYVNGERIWKPAFESPYIYKDDYGKCWLKSLHAGSIQLQKLHTRNRRSIYSGLRGQNISVRTYRGQYGNNEITKIGFYRYRLVQNGKKTQWRTISIMSTALDAYSIK